MLCEKDINFDFNLGICVKQASKIENFITAYMNLTNEEICLKSSLDHFKISTEITLDSLINFFLSYNNFNFQQIPDLGLSQIDNLIKDLCQLEDCEENLYKQLKQQIQQITQIVNEILKKIKNKTNMKGNDILKSLHCNIDKQILVQPKPLSILKPNLNPFTFELMDQNSIKQQEWYQITQSQQLDLKMTLKFFNINKGDLIIYSQLREHKNHVNTLNFMKNSNNFVSGSIDRSIIIWQENGHNQWKCQQKLNGHQEQISCLLLNNIDELIISGSQDGTIKFWMKQNQWICQQTISDHTGWVYSLSLNEEQNKLISCQTDQQILVIELLKWDKKWSVTQKLKVDQYGCRLCFINDNQFTFQPFCKEQIHLYELDSNTKWYKKVKQIAVKCGSSNDVSLFPQQYFKQKCLLVNKNGCNINLMRKQENGDFIIEQSIQYNSYIIFGQLSNDGEYLITWDYESKEIQIRKCKD
ncbi:unnamed protein product [Paramecium pentaurelia]|uniref:WD40-repeat-containing domain n=1 Tax=Paramecium pentaurelia TaxID=43138 RepID=A0A8S1YJK6_9CILI|nr:unnamed protein product [Paramecium pentaurelia]